MTERDLAQSNRKLQLSNQDNDKKHHKSALAFSIPAWNPCVKSICLRTQIRFPRRQKGIFYYGKRSPSYHVATPFLGCTITFLVARYILLPLEVPRMPTTSHPPSHFAATDTSLVLVDSPYASSSSRGGGGAREGVGGMRLPSE